MTLVRKTLRDDGRAFLGWALGVAVFTAVYVGFYPQLRDTAAETKQKALPQGMKDFLGVTDMTTGTGYLQATVYAFLIPLLLIMFAAIVGNRAIAVPEEAGTLDVLLANPTSRRRFVLERYTAVALQVVVLAAIPWVIVLVLVSALDIGVSAEKISAASLPLVLLALFFGTLAFAVGAATGRRSIVLAVVGVVAVGTYLVKALGGVTEAIEPLRWISPFHYYSGNDPLVHGFHAGYLAVLAVTSLVLLVAAITTFDRRDVGV